MWLLILQGFLASTGVVWLLVIWPLAMSSNPTDPGQFLTYLVSTFAIGAAFVLIGGIALMPLVQKILRWL